MKHNTILTKKGKTSYYTMDDIYPEMLTFFVKYDDELSENEFSVPMNLMRVNNLTVTEKEYLVILFTNSYEKGRQRGRWEKAKKIGELFSSFQREILG